MVGLWPHGVGSSGKKEDHQVIGGTGPLTGLTNLHFDISSVRSGIEPEGKLENVEAGFVAATKRSSMRLNQTRLDGDALLFCAWQPERLKGSRTSLWTLL
jgi:hypothetical protein